MITTSSFSRFFGLGSINPPQQVATPTYVLRALDGDSYFEPPTARYWRIKDIQLPPGADYLEISELQFLSGGVRQIGTLSSSINPQVGSISILNDNALNVSVYWTVQVVTQTPFWIKFDAGEQVQITGIKQGGFDNNLRYMKGFTIEYSTNGTTWIPFNIFSNLTYPGNNTLSSEYALPNVALLLNMNGTDGSTTFTDNSSNPKTVTANGGAQISTAQSKFGGSSLFTGTSGSNFLRIQQSNDLIFGTGDFTVEGWFLPTSGGNESTFYIHGINTIGGLTLFVGTGGARFRANGTTDLVANSTISTFTHIAFVRSGNTRYIFINGNLAASDTLSFNNSDNDVTDIGASSQNSLDTFRYYGYIDDLRITKGVARYTSNFNPPSSQFAGQVISLDEGQSSTFSVDTSNVADGTTLYWGLASSSTASSNDFDSSSGSFTINNDTGQFTVSITEDLATEGGESFAVNVRTGSASGPIVATSGIILIADTSTS